MAYTKNLALFVSLFLVQLFNGCNTKKEMQFCFSTIIEGDIFVSPVKVGNSYSPCGFLSSYGDDREIKDNNYNFESTKGFCGAVADGYHMEIPDSAFLEWGTGGGVMHKKNLKLPSFPKLKPGEKYQVGFVIAYQDCVYVWIQTVPKY